MGIKLKSSFIENLYIIRTTAHQSLICSPFEAHFGRKDNATWHKILRDASSSKLSIIKNVLYILDKNKKISRTRDMQDHTIADDDSKMRV